METGLGTCGKERRVVSMAQPRGDSLTLCPGFMLGPQMRPGMSSVNSVSAKPCIQANTADEFHASDQTLQRADNQDDL